MGKNTTTTVLRTNEKEATEMSKKLFIKKEKEYLSIPAYTEKAMFCRICPFGLPISATPFFDNFFGQFFPVVVGWRGKELHHQKANKEHELSVE